MTGHVIIFLLSMFGLNADTANADGSRSGKEFQYYSIELINGNIAGIRAEMLNNKYPENMKHEVREHVQYSFAEMLMSVISPRDTASGLPTGKRQHKPFNAGGGGYNEITLDDSSGAER